MRKLFFTTLMVFATLLTACNSSSTSTPMNSASNEMPIETQFAVGTLKLVGTDQDISQEQAEELVLYWQVYRELSQSDTAAQAEVDGLIKQIQETMTADQMQAITDMQLTQQDVLTSMQGAAVVSSSADSETISLPSGGPPADGGGAPMEGGMPADMGSAESASGAAQSESEQTGPGSESLATVPSALVDAVIQSLQGKIAA